MRTTKKKEFNNSATMALMRQTQAETVSSSTGVWLDRRSRTLLMTLIRDGTINREAMSRHVGLSANAVHYRFERMLSAGLIQGTVAKVNRKLLGYNEVGFIRVMAMKEVDLHELTQLRGVLAVYRGITANDFLFVITTVNFDDHCTVLRGIIDATGDTRPLDLFRGSVFHEDYEGGNVFRHLFKEEVKPITNKPGKRLEAQQDG